MTGDENQGFTRRSFLAASAAMMVARRVRAHPSASPALCWRLDGEGDSAVESVSRSRDAIVSRTGHAIWVGQGGERAMRFDGYSNWFRHTPNSSIALGDAITLMAWVALEAYPVTEAALLHMDTKLGMAIRFSVDRFGYLQCSRRDGDQTNLCRSTEPIAKAQWVHLAASMGSDGINLFRDGTLFGHQPGSFGPIGTLDGAHVMIGASPDSEIIANVFQTGAINGLLREVQVFDRRLSSNTLTEIIAVSKPDSSPDLQINGPWCVDDPQRPVCHAQPPRAWTNEPHGLIHWGGQYHLFYQKNPDGPYWSRLNWGHMCSPDLLRWTEMPVALTPELPYESKGCWSGSVIDYAGKLTLIYTAVDEVKAGVSLAFSDDGVNFTKYAGNPVIPSPPNYVDYLDFRDPYVWREGDVYYLIIGSGIKNTGGTALLYRSKDLVEWEYLRELLSGDKTTSGTFWEMPIFLKDRDRHALVVCEVPGRESYWVGQWKDERFVPISSAPQHLELFHHLLSPTPFAEEDGQIVVMGIIPDERPAQELWLAGWAHLYSFPRVLSIEASGRITQKPHPRLDALCRPLPAVSAIDLEAGSSHAVAGFAETSLRVRGTFIRGQSTTVSLLLRRSPSGEEQTEMIYDWEHAQFVLDRTKSSLDPRVRRDRQEAAYRPALKDSIHFDIFVDRSVVEVFVDGCASFATRIYPTLRTSTGVAFRAEGSGARIENLSLARLEPLPPVHSDIILPAAVGRLTQKEL